MTKKNASTPSSSDINTPEEPQVRVALITVMGFAISTVLKVIDDRPDVTIACVVTCTGPRSRRSDAHLEVIRALWDNNYPNVDVLVSNKRSKYADLMAQYNVDLILSVGYPWLLPESLLEDKRIRLGAVNFHNSHLPKYRGPNAFGWAICNGDKQLGFCAHRMDGSFDTGPILVKDSVSIGVNEGMEELMAKIPERFMKMVDRAITLAIEEAPGEPQVGEPSQAPKFDDDFRWIDFASSALSIHNKVRAFYGARDIPKGALAKVEGETLCFVKTRIEENPNLSASKKNQPSPGTVLSRTVNTFEILCGDTSLEVIEWHRVVGDEQNT